VGPGGPSRERVAVRRVECSDWAAKEEVSKKKKMKDKNDPPNLTSHSCPTSYGKEQWLAADKKM
jgi:hypothetical protein